MTAPLTIRSLHVENVKRIRVVDITPGEDDSVVILAGRNASGKSSVLDAIIAALGGPRALKDQPEMVRRGTDGAVSRILLGDYEVTRRWKADGSTTLEVRTADGAKYSKPQALLDGFLGKISFDPLAFANMPAKDQRATLLGLVELPFDLDRADALRKEAFDERTEANRDLKSLEAQLAGLPAADAAVLDGPTLDEAVRALHDGQRESSSALMLRNSIVRIDGDIAELQRRIRELEGDRADIVTSLGEMLIEPDIAALEAAVHAAGERATLAERAGQRKGLETQVGVQRAIVESKAAYLATIDGKKAEALAAAKMPIDGLGLDDDGVTFNSIPFSQCSRAQRVRVSFAIAMAANPTMRVILIADGAVLDDDNMRHVRQMAEAGGFQVWIERVAATDASCIVIEDGTVAGAVSADL